MSIKRFQQHKPQRDTRVNKEVQALKSEKKRLEKEKARLQKELTKALQIRNAFEDHDPEVEDQREDILEPTLNSCPECGDLKVRVIELAGKQFLVCPECKWRKKVETVNE